uniref:dTDP-4-dehydrorhamnose reductase n=1 Tax=Candidatus Kentrum sp. FW TaxID=2126338 RepID=A0A450TK31_9GAMM|nr:MAG: dTDP-4-dehydrorhamnose reductase [Candidatus Kentron sp. FW]
MRILVTGAAGLIGKHITAHLRAAHQQVVAVDIVSCNGVIRADLQNEATVFRLLKEHTPDSIVHLAAIKNLSFCEQNKDTAHAINYGITEILTHACRESETRMIFFSSDYVFGRHDRFWQEADLPCPTTQYGRDKAASERLIHRELTDYAIIRPAQLYGFSKDFVSLVCRTLISCRPLIAFANLVNCPTWIGDLLAMSSRIIRHGHQGIFHCVGPEAVSRYQYAIAIAEAFSLNASFIRAVDLDFSTDIRPPVVRLDGASTYEVLRIHPGGLKDNLPLCSSYAMEAG